MILPSELTYVLHVVTACILTGLMGIVTIYWMIRMRGIGGTAGKGFTMFFLLIAIYAIFQGLYPSAVSLEKATLLGCVAYLSVNAGVLCIVLAGEYSTTDRPPPWRMTLLGLSYGIVCFFLVFTIISPPGAGMLIMSYVPSFGWVLQTKPIYLWANGIFASGAICFFLEFCLKAYRAASPSTQFSANGRKLVISFVFSVIIVGASVGGGGLYTDFIAEMPALTMGFTSLSMLYIFSLMTKESQIMFLLPQKATCLFVLNTSGIVYYDHMFQSKDDPLATVNLFAPALAAVNFIMQDSLQLNNDDWIKEFHTDTRTFLLEVRADLDLVGVLLVSNPTQMLRNALVHFLDHLTPIWRSNKNQLDLSEEETHRIDQIIKDAFPFIPT